MKRNVELVSKNTNNLKLKLKKNGEGFLVANAINYLFINGIKDKNGKLLKPIIIPIYITDADDIVKIDEIYKSNPEDTDWEWTKNILDIDCTSLAFNNLTILNWDTVSDAINSKFSQYVSLLKEVRNRIPKYEIMYQDMYNSGIFPKNGLKVGNSTFKNEIKIWDRFVVNGKKVDLVFYDRNLAIAIYDRGYDWIINPNFLYSDLGIAYY